MNKYIILLLIVTCSVRGEVEFTGFMISPKEALYSLGDTEDHASSGWLKIGGAFRGYTVVSFDRERDVITLRKSGQALELHLRDSKVKDGKAIISGFITAGAEQLNGVRASLFLGEEATFPVKEGLTLFLKPERMADGNIKYSARFVATGKDGKQETVSSPVVIARPGSAFGIRIGEYGYRFSP